MGSRSPQPLATTNAVDQLRGERDLAIISDDETDSEANSIASSAAAASLTMHINRPSSFETQSSIINPFFQKRVGYERRYSGIKAL